ncbi:MAG: GIY-YIG nuclease family protein [Fidelibacterota bacterium]
MWFVYALENKEKNFLYIGYSNNLTRRLKEHSDGKTQSTKAYRHNPRTFKQSNRIIYI